jgi:uncharacterized repeat protein (TIGR01451 family)
LRLEVLEDRTLLSGIWSETGSLTTARLGATATLLNDGEVLVAGGGSDQPEVYDPSTGTWSATGSLIDASEGATATLLNDGEVLVAGGQDIGGYLSSAELYDPSTGAWSPTGSLTTAREGATATLLKNGEVLVAGGVGNSGAPSSAELYDPSTGAWSATGSLIDARFGATATLLKNGEVLVVGGSDTASSAELSSAELYDPSTGAWSATGSLIDGRSGATATLLNNGEVLVAGGNGIASLADILSSAELYNPATGTWSATGPMNTARDGATATLMSDGEVLVAGGGDNSLSSAELYDPSTGAWSPTGSLIDGRSDATATLLNDGEVLVAGGDGGRYVLASAELYNPDSPLTASTTTLSVLPSVVSVGQTVTLGATVTGGTGSLAPTGTVTFEDVTAYGPVTLATVSLRGNGTASFSTDSLSVLNYFIGNQYYVQAVYSGDVNNSVSKSPLQTVTVSPLVVEVTGPPSGSLTSGADATYTVTLMNAGSRDVAGITLTDAVPSGTTFISATQTSGPAATLTSPPAGGNGTITAVIADLPAGQSVTLQLVFQAGATLSITDTATASLVGGSEPQVVSAPVQTTVIVPVPLTLSSTTVLDGSPPGTVVGTLLYSLPVVSAGQFFPATYSLPPSEADNRDFALVATAGGEALVTQFQASAATKATYQVIVHIDVGYDTPPTTLVVTITLDNGGGRSVSDDDIKLVLLKRGKKKARLMVEVRDLMTGTEEEFLSPFQSPAFKHIAVSVRPGFPDEFFLTARKGKRTLTQTFPAY